MSLTRAFCTLTLLVSTRTEALGVEHLVIGLSDLEEDGGLEIKKLGLALLDGVAGAAELGGVLEAIKEGDASGDGDVDEGRFGDVSEAGSLIDVADGGGEADGREERGEGAVAGNERLNVGLALDRQLLVAAVGQNQGLLEGQGLVVVDVIDMRGLFAVQHFAVEGDFGLLIDRAAIGEEEEGRESRGGDEARGGWK